MNKILLDEFNKRINITENSVLYIYNVEEDINLEIDMEDSTELLILDFNINNKSTKIKINQKNNDTVNYIHTFKITGTYNFEYIANIEGNNNINNVNIKGITSGNVSMYVEGIAKEKTKNNYLNENIKVLNLGGKVFTSPMLHISTLDIIANHNTAISNIRSDELQYLNSKGISNMAAISLIENGYLYGPFKEYEEFLNLIK